MKPRKKFLPPLTPPETPRKPPGTPKPRVDWKRFLKTGCSSFAVQETLTTEQLDVPGVEVVTKTKGRAFAGPFYPDQIDLLRDTLRGMPKREKHQVLAEAATLWIYRKP